jgi:ABC-type uncharacterized transport system ATPase subunit
MSIIQTCKLDCLFLSVSPFHLLLNRFINIEKMRVQRMIETVNLTREYGNLAAVDDVSFKIDKGEVFGFLGPNGAGKTTTIRMLACLISPRQTHERFFTMLL